MILWELVFSCTNTMTYIVPTKHEMINLESTIVDGWVSPNSVYQRHCQNVNKSELCVFPFITGNHNDYCRTKSPQE